MIKIKGFFKNGSPIIDLMIEGRSLEVMVDTGFNGYLLLPQKLIDDLEFNQIGFSDYKTASGEIRETNVYKYYLNFFDEKLEVIVISTDADICLAGMELFNSCRILIERCNNFVEISLIRNGNGNNKY